MREPRKLADKSFIVPHGESDGDRYRLDCSVARRRVVVFRIQYEAYIHSGWRAIVRYDSSARKVLTDFLASFEPVPGTVAYVGYGSLFEQRGWDGASWQPGEGDYRVSRRGLFLKASYAKRF